MQTLETVSCTELHQVIVMDLGLVAPGQPCYLELTGLDVLA